MKHIVITLQNPLDESDTLDLPFVVQDTDIGMDWFDNCVQSLQNNARLEKNFQWLGWPDPNRNVEYLSGRLQECVNIINNFADNNVELWDGYRIDENWDDITSDDALNQLHHHFELLMGQVWDVAHYMKTADDPTSYQIRQLNNLVHELASRKSAINPGGMTVISYLDPVRMEFKDEYYDNFSIKRSFGDIFLHYAQTGKTPIEAWEDNDDYVFNNNINALRYMSGEFNIWWSGTETDKNISRKKQELETWLRSRNVVVDKHPNFCYYIDTEGNKQGIGWINVAKLENPFSTEHELLAQINTKLNIYKMVCYDNNTIVAENTWDYKWSDPDYFENEIEFLSPRFPR